LNLCPVGARIARPHTQKPIARPMVVGARIARPHTRTSILANRVIKMNEYLPKRKPNRLRDYDYSQKGAYFITICVKDRKCILGNITIGDIAHIQLSTIGKIVDNTIRNIPHIYNDAVSIEKYVIMPNHIHMIIMMPENVDGRAMRAPTISTIINQMKGFVTKKVGYSIWQKLFYDRIIRNQQEYEKTYEYIETNPSKWQEDKYYIFE